LSRSRQPRWTDSGACATVTGIRRWPKGRQSRPGAGRLLPSRATWMKTLAVCSPDPRGAAAPTAPEQSGALRVKPIRDRSAWAIRSLSNPPNTGARRRWSSIGADRYTVRWCPYASGQRTYDAVARARRHRRPDLPRGLSHWRQPTGCGSIDSCSRCEWSVSDVGRRCSPTAKLGSAATSARSAVLALTSSAPRALTVAVSSSDGHAVSREHAVPVAQISMGGSPGTRIDTRDVTAVGDVQHVGGRFPGTSMVV
jgi:hypothetical protein